MVKGGHIHTSFQVLAEHGFFFLQKFNTSVFPHPNVVVGNYLRISALSDQAPTMARLLFTDEQEPFATDDEGGFWRLMGWMENSIPFPVKKKNPQEAARHFARWTRAINHADPRECQVPIEGFHHLPSIWQAFLKAWNQSEGTRKYAAAETYGRLLRGEPLLDRFHSLAEWLPLRIIHGDAKADNLLVDADSHEFICVVDLDTVMPGYLWMDVGDLIRSLAASVGESDERLEKVAVIPEIVQKITDAWAEELSGWSTDAELASLKPGAAIIIYEQALRFLTDFLQEDLYYPVSYPEENLIRAQNQLLLWESYEEWLGG